MAPQHPAGYPYRSHSWFMIVVAVVLGIIAAFAFGGDPLGDIPGMTWLAASWSAFLIAWLV